jgi:Niemann-Pick C1 protein
MLLQPFLSATAEAKCPFGGKAAFSYTVNLTKDSEVLASYLSTYHLPVRSSKDMVDSIVAARAVADEAQATLNEMGVFSRIYPYSIFYVFYEQYLTTWKTTLIGLGSSILGVFVIVSLSRALKSINLHVILLFALVSHVIHIMGLMKLANIELNALSLVNLIMSVGISVEFINHLLVAFARKTNHKQEHSIMTLVLEDTGSSLLSGIILTKIIGILVLAFATSKIFSIYYFRFYLLVVSVGAVHGLIYLPALLTILESAHKIVRSTV